MKLEENVLTMCKIKNFEMIIVDKKEKPFIRTHSDRILNKEKNLYSKKLKVITKKMC